MEDKRLSWSLTSIWNKTLLMRQDSWEFKPRNYIRSSELGGAFLDRYYKLKGIQSTNPYDERTLRKFEAGNLFEWLVGNVLKRAGLLVKTQDTIKVGYPNCLTVWGHYDYKVSPPESWEKARESVKEVEYPVKLEQIALKLIDYLQEKYALIYASNGELKSGMKTILYEIKSVNSMVFWSRIDQLYNAYPHHRLQLYSYLKGTGIEEGRLLYISKDDMTVVETGVFLSDEKTEQLLREDIEYMTRCYKENLEPPREEDLVFDKAKNKWRLNWHIQFSSYLTKITGLSREEWEKQAVSEMGKRNRRIKKEIKEAKEKNGK